MPPNPNDVTMSIGGRLFGGWERLSVTRGLEHMASAFSLTVADRWDPAAAPWPIHPFDACAIKIGTDTVLTGYVDTVAPEIDARHHAITVTGRGKTGQLIDCTPDIAGGQFNGYTLDKIARGICSPFGIGVVVQAGVGGPFPDATIERAETGYRFLERLARLRSVFVTDDPQGNLVIAIAGSTRATTSLRQGVNIRRISARLGSPRRFSTYRVKTQTGTVTAAPSPPLNPIGGPPPSPTTSVATQRAATTAYYDAADPPQTPAVTVTLGVATDSGVPLYRPHTIVAESSLDAGGATARARWEAAIAYGRSVLVTVETPGWRQNDGSLWTLNTLVSVVSPALQLDAELLIVAVSYELSGQGRITRLSLGPVEGFSPEPAAALARPPAGPGAASYTTTISPAPSGHVLNPITP